METQKFNGEDPLVDIVCDYNLGILQMEQAIGSSEKIVQMLMNDEHEMQSQVSEVARQIIVANYNMS